MCDVNCIIINSGKYLLLDHIVPDAYTVDEWIYSFKEEPEKARELFIACMMTAPPDAADGHNSILYNGKSIETDGEKYWYMNADGKTVPCFPVNGTAEDGSKTILCWWDTRSDGYNPF